MKTFTAATLAALIGTASIVAIPALPVSAATVTVHVGGGGWMWHGRRWHHRHWDCRWHRHHHRACYWRYW